MIQGKPYLLREGEGVMIAPFVDHSYRKQSEEWLTCFATFTGTVESCIPSMLGNRQVIFVEKEQGKQIYEWIQRVIPRYQMLALDTRQLSMDCYGMLMYFVDGVSTREMQENPLYQRYVEPVMKEIERNYDLELTVQTLCAKVYVTPQYLSRLFRRFLGCSVYEYLTSYRITKAKEYLLTDSQKKVQEIAAQVGFQDTSHFISMFRKVTGVTPLEFRKLN